MLADHVGSVESASRLVGCRLLDSVGVREGVEVAQDSNRSGQQQNPGHVKFRSVLLALPMLT